jgi:hypothetical protein
LIEPQATFLVLTTVAGMTVLFEERLNVLGEINRTICRRREPVWFGRGGRCDLSEQCTPENEQAKNSQQRAHGMRSSGRQRRAGGRHRWQELHWTNGGLGRQIRFGNSCKEIENLQIRAVIGRFRVWANLLHRAAGLHGD